MDTVIREEPGLTIDLDQRVRANNPTLTRIRRPVLWLTEVSRIHTTERGNAVALANDQLIVHCEERERWRWLCDGSIDDVVQTCVAGRRVIRLRMVDLQRICWDIGQEQVPEIDCTRPCNRRTTTQWRYNTSRRCVRLWRINTVQQDQDVIMERNKIDAGRICAIETCSYNIKL